jgi:hypothetical protein
MLKNIKTLALLLLVAAAFTAPAAVAEQLSDSGEDSDQVKACKSALNDAEDDLINKVKTNSALAPASTEAQENPVAKILEKQAEITQKRAELNQQKIEKKGQLADEQYKQASAIDDKLHEYRQEEPKLRQEVTTIQLAKQKLCTDIINKCWDKADEEYAALYEQNSALAASTNFKTNSLQFARGTGNRMIAQKQVFYNLCLAKPQTQNSFKMATEEVNAKMKNLKIETEKNLSDICYIESKIPDMNANFAQKYADLEASAATQEQALNQASMLQMAAAAMSMSTASAGADSGGEAAATMRSARETLDKFRAIRIQCLNATSNPIDVPDDVYVDIFLAVNKACRPDSSPGQYCVRSSRANSTDLPPANTKSN